MKKNQEEKTNTLAESLLPAAIVENLSEESLKKVEEKLNNIVESKVNERVNLAVESAEATFDAEANKDIDKLVVKIEEAHKRMAYKTCKTLKENYEKKLKKVRAYYNDKVQKDADKFKNNLVESVNAYIDKQLDKAIPYEDLKIAFKNNTAMKVLESLKTVLGVANAATCAKQYFKKPILEAKQKLISYNKKCKQLTETANNLQRELDESKKQAYLEEKLKGLDEDSANFMRRTMKNATMEFIKENFNFALDKHKEKLNEEKENLKQRALSNPKRKQVQSVSRSMLVENNKPQRHNYSDGISNLITSVLSDND